MDSSPYKEDAWIGEEQNDTTYTVRIQTKNASLFLWVSKEQVQDGTQTEGLEWRTPEFYLKGSYLLNVLCSLLFSATVVVPNPLKEVKP